MPAIVTPSQSQLPPGKNVKRKSSKPIINWFQRKLAGTVRTRRISASSANADVHPVQPATSLKELHAVMQQQQSPTSPTARDEDGFHPSQEMRRAMSNEISLNGDDDISTRKSMSLWSRSNPLEADEDASIRPLPPTSPPSPSPSRSSSSYLSDPRTFKSMSASTKPTTLLSIDLAHGTNGMAHIAQVPPTPTHTTSPSASAGPANRFPPHVRTSSNISTGPGTSITFSALPPSPQSSSRPSSLNPVRAGSGSGSGLGSGMGGAGFVSSGATTIQAPQHTAHHPRNNPRPSSPPLDNASMLTLASSAFATSGVRTGGYAWTGGYGGDSVSHLGGGDSLSQFVPDDALTTEDHDASVRALRPRSSRRGSWDSETSGWSAHLSALGGGTGFAGRERSVRTAPSFRTGGQATVEDQDGNGSIMDSMKAEGQETDSPDGEENEQEKEGESPSTGSYDGEELPEDSADVTTPGMKTKELHVVIPDMTPRSDKVQAPGEKDNADEDLSRGRRDTVTQHKESKGNGHAQDALDALPLDTGGVA